MALLALTIRCDNVQISRSANDEALLGSPLAPREHELEPSTCSWSKRYTYSRGLDDWSRVSGVILESF